LKKVPSFYFVFDCLFHVKEVNSFLQIKCIILKSNSLVSSLDRHWHTIHTIGADLSTKIGALEAMEDHLLERRRITYSNERSPDFGPCQ